MKTAVLFAFSLFSTFAQEPVRYTLSFPAPHTHYLEVTASIPAGGPSVELYQPVWTPGSYLVREYSRNVEGFQARGGSGKTLAWEKTRKNRWRIAAAGESKIEVSYKVYAREMSVQGNYVETGFAMLNGAPNFMTLVGADRRQYEVKVVLPAGWRTSISGMKSGPAPNTWLAADWDELLDCPIYAGSAPIHEFEVEGKKHYLVNEGEGPMWDGPGSAKEVAKIVAEYSRQWGGLPYEKYVFFNMLTETGGGLEHRNSTWLGASRWAYGSAPAANGGGNGGDGQANGGRRPTRFGWLGLVSHEYVHLWNVKRLRPVELGPFDYENEVYTKSLWLAEGVTSYYGPLALRRAGITTQDQLLGSVSGSIATLQSLPGRLVTPVEWASYNAWIGLYRPNENSPNTTINYYTKGMVIGFLLDAKIRKASSGTKSLDDAMLLAYQRYGRAKGYTPEQFRSVCNEVAGTDLGGWFERVLSTTEELDYSEALGYYGLRFKPIVEKPGEQQPLETGITVVSTTGRILVTGLRRGTAGYDCGLSVEDEILAVNGYRVRAEHWPARLDNYTPGTTVELLIARRDKLMTVQMPLRQQKAVSWSLEVKPDATGEQKARLKAWMRDAS